METNIHSHLKVVCLQCRKKNLRLDYRWENHPLHYIYSAITSMSHPLWTQLTVSEQGYTLKNTLLLSRFLLHSQLEHASFSPFHLGLVKDSRNDNVGKPVLAGSSVQLGQILASQKHIWRWQLTSLCFLAGGRSSISLQIDSGRVREQAWSLLLCKDMY